MKRKFSFFVASAVLASAFPLSGALLAQDPQPANPPSEKTQAQQDQMPPSKQGEAKMFSGKIMKSHGKYTLQDSSGSTAYVLDDQKTAKQYEGKVVMVTGTLDETNNIIHVQKIEAAA